jgi:hypothetical protein
VDELDAITARVADSTGIPELLDTGFDAFEAIRYVSRACEGQAPGLFAAFMLAAGTAVEGRNALTDAPSIPPSRGGLVLEPAVIAADDVDDVADALAQLASRLAQRLAEAAMQADLAGDRSACQQASRSATDIHELLGLTA